MDHAVRTSKTKPWNKLHFENEELECLYQRYTLKMQRFSVIGVVSLLVIFCMTMVTLSYLFSSLLTLHVSLFLWNFFILSLYSYIYSWVISSCYLLHANDACFLLLHRNFNEFLWFSLQNIFISLMCFLFLIILALLQFRVIQDSYLLFLCHGILLAATILCVMSMPALSKIIPIDTKEVNCNCLVCPTLLSPFIRCLCIRLKSIISSY